MNSMKYLGGKQRLGKYISFFLKEIMVNLTKEDILLNGYLEPFCGSLGVLKQMTDIDIPVTGNDYHPDLIEMWKEVKKKTFIYPSHISNEEYNAAKQLPSPSALKSFIGFGLSFGGRYFGAFAHKYINDKKEDFCKEMVNSLKRMEPLIQNVEFTNIDYKEMNPENMFIYCDPPYRSITYPIKYRKGIKHYDVFDNDEFWEIMRKWSLYNVVIISEMSAPEDFIEIWTLDRYRSACQSTKTRFKATSETYKKEKLFVYSKSKYINIIYPNVNND